MDVRTVNIHEARGHLSRLIERAASGKPFVVAKAGRTLVKVMPVDAPERGAERPLGFLAGQADVPDDFDRMGAVEIGSLFGRDG